MLIVGSTSDRTAKLRIIFFELTSMWNRGSSANETETVFLKHNSRTNSVAGQIGCLGRVLCSAVRLQLGTFQGLVMFMVTCNTFYTGSLLRSESLTRSLLSCGNAFKVQPLHIWGSFIAPPWMCRASTRSVPLCRVSFLSMVHNFFSAVDPLI